MALNINICHGGPDPRSIAAPYQRKSVLKIPLTLHVDAAGRALAENNKEIAVVMEKECNELESETFNRLYSVQLDGVLHWKRRVHQRCGSQWTTTTNSISAEISLAELLMNPRLLA